jgi:hypothetical protein
MIEMFQSSSGKMLPNNPSYVCVHHCHGQSHPKFLTGSTLLHVGQRRNSVSGDNAGSPVGGHARVSVEVPGL